MKCMELITNNFLTIFFRNKLLQVVEMKMDFEKKAVLILNDVAEIVLKWNLGKLSEKQALSKINEVFRK